VIKYIFKKIFYGFLVLLGVITVIFFLFNVLPGDPATILLGQRANKESIEAINRDLGRDKPLSTQYLMYLNDLSFISFHNKSDQRSAFYLDDQKYEYAHIADLGEQEVMVVKMPYLRRSYITKRRVSEIISETLPETTVLATASIIVASILGIALGILAAVKKNTFFDRLSLVLSALGMSAPSFFIGVIIAWLFGYILSEYTGLNSVGSLFVFDVDGERMELKNLILPTITLGMRPLAIIVQLTRSSLLDVLSQDYIRTARAKGLGYYVIVFKHALKNALNPVITAISGWFAGLMAGAVFVEIIFDWKGIGYEVYDALTKNDLPVVMGATIIFATFFVLINIMVDITYGVLDPRVRVK
jgi:peptide/nickel transport system permease protein